MNLYLFKVVFKYYAPKDSAEGIFGWYISSSERELAEYLNLVEEDSTIEVWDSNLNRLIDVPEIENVLKEKGDWYKEPCDLYYGFTHTGWEPGIEITPEQAEVLVSLGVAEKI